MEVSTMKESEKKARGLSRRNFIKLSAAGIGAAALTGVTDIAEASSRTELEPIEGEGCKLLKPVGRPLKWDYTADVVIVGGGGSGLAAGVSAIEKGVKVIVLEKNGFCGGDTSIAMVMEGHFGSRLQKSVGFPEKPIAERVQYDLTIPNPTSGRNPTLVRMVQSTIADTANWLEDIGVVYETKEVGPIPAGFAHCPIDPKHPEEGYYRWDPHNGRGFTEALEKRFLKIGGKILKSHPAQALVFENGRVIGVKSVNQHGADVYVEAKSVILATGGFGANRDMLLKYGVPRKVVGARYWGMPGAQGDGIRMAMALDADIDGMEEIEIWDGGALLEHGATGVYSAPNQLVRQKSLTVNKEAKRFFGESLYRGYYYSYQAAQTLSQRDQMSFTLFDSNCITKEDIIKKFDGAYCEYPTPWFEEQFKKYLAEGVIKKANTIPELAGMLGLEPNELVKTVNRYNELCDKGEDTDFFKEAKYMQPIRKAPFYGVGQKGGSCFNTWGGLIVDEKFRVLDTKRKPIQGLFVAGENAAGGASIAYALPTGRLAGGFAAAQALGK